MKENIVGSYCELIQLKCGYNDFKIDTDGYNPNLTHTTNDKKYILTYTQTKIAIMLLNNLGKEVIKMDIISEVFDSDNYELMNSKLRVYIANIRKFFMARDPRYKLVTNRDYSILLTYVKPVDKIEETKKTLLHLLTTQSSDQISNNDLELINLLKNDQN